MFVDIINNNLSLHLKQSFPPTIWFFIEGEGDGIKSRLPSKIFSTLETIPSFYEICSFFVVSKHKNIEITEMEKITH